MTDHAHDIREDTDDTPPTPATESPIDWGDGFDWGGGNWQEDDVSDMWGGAFVPDWETPLSRHTIRGDRYDERVWQDVLRQGSGLRKLMDSGSQKLRNFPELAEDIFRSLYKYAPMREEKHNLEWGVRPHLPLIEQIANLPEWTELRETSTKFNEFSSALGTMTLSKKLLDAIDEALAEALSRVQEAIENGEMPDPGDMQTVADLMGPALDKIRQAMRKAIAEAQSESDQETEGQQVFGGGQDGGGYSPAGHGQGQGMNFQEKLDLSKKLKKNPKLRAVAKQVGKMRNIAFGRSRALVKHVPGGPVDVESGNDISRALPSEIAALCLPETEFSFYRKVAESQLQQWVTASRDPAGQGPIILAVDGSGSMGAHFSTEHDSGTEYDTREVWSKAVALNLLGIATRQKRDFLYMVFDSDYKPEEVKTWVFRKGRATSAQLIEVAEYFPAGGTAYEGWMLRALQALKETRWKNADVIVVSDGDCSVGTGMQEDWRKEKRLKNFRCYGVLIGDDGSGGALPTICDSVMPIRGDQRAKSDTKEEESTALGTIFNI